MAAHRYWRLFVGASASSAYVTIGELMLATTPGGASVATGGTPSASSSYSGSTTPDKAFDGTLGTTCWNSAATYSAWLQYDLGAGNEKDIVEIRIYFPSSGSNVSEAPSSFLLYWSDNGQTWTRQSQWSGQVFTAGETKTLDATPIPDASITNRLVLDKRFRFNDAAQSQSAINFTARRFRMLFAQDNYLAPARNTPYSGTKRIAGSTTVLGMPAARTVHLLEQKSGLIIATQHTQADGQFEFREIADGFYTVMGVDPSGAQNSIVYAHVSAVD